MRAPARPDAWPLDHQLGDAGVTGRVAVGAAGHDLALHGAAELGHLLGPFIDQQQDQVHLGMVDRHRLGDVLQQDVLPVRGGATIRPRWPLPMGASMSITRVVNGSWPVSRWICSCGSMGVRSSKLRRRYSSAGRPSMVATLCQPRPGPLAGRLNRAGQQQSLAQAQLLDQLSGNVGVARLRDVVAGSLPQEAIPLGMQFQDALGQ